MYLPQVPPITSGENIFTAVNPAFHRMSSRQRKSRNKSKNGVKKRVVALKTTKEAEETAFKMASTFLATMDQVCSNQNGPKLGTINLGEKSHGQYGYHLDGIILSIALKRFCILKGDHESLPMLMMLRCIQYKPDNVMAHETPPDNVMAHGMAHGTPGLVEAA
jgi:hypothetical protein